MASQKPVSTQTHVLLQDVEVQVWIFRLLYLVSSSPGNGEPSSNLIAEC